MLSGNLANKNSILQQTVLRAINLPRSLKSLILVLIDYIASLIAFLLAVALRYGDFEQHIDIWFVISYSAFPIILLYYTKFYSNVIRIFHDESMRIVLMVLFLSLIIGEILTLPSLGLHLPRAAPAIHMFLLYIWLWNSRIILQFFLPKILEPSNKQQNKQTVMIYGVGNVAKDLINALRQTSQYQVLGIIDNRTEMTNGQVLGIKIYSDEHLEKIIQDFKVEHIFFALPKNRRYLQSSVIQRLSDKPIKFSDIPSFDEMDHNKLKLSDIKPVDVLDVLQRDTVLPDENLLSKNIQNKVVLITGAGGSIGSELCRQIIKQRPSIIILFELSEFALYSIHQEIKALIAKYYDQTNNDIKFNIGVKAYLGSVTNQNLLEEIFQKHQVQTIYHAAAYKHVPIVERNEYEGVMNNFVGTYRAVTAAINSQVETFVAISTDKAVRPTNIMGASKRMAELACQALAQEQSTTIISMVRFGNVLGSSGSVVPLFNKQIARGGPVTVTHPEVTRYFMTIPEAAQLVIQAGAMATGGEVFVLDMGEPIKITDLARRMIRLSGFDIKDDSKKQEGIEIQYVGLRPGEKLYEELIIGGNNIRKTSHQLIMQAREQSFTKYEIENFLNQLIKNYNQSKDIDWLKKQFEYFVEGYKDRANRKEDLVDAF